MKTSYILCSILLFLLCIKAYTQEGKDRFLESGAFVEQDTIPQTRKILEGDEPTGDGKKIEVPGIPIFPSPTVAEMMKYTDFPTVDQFGGVPIQIPIYNIKGNDLSHEIYLSYHSGGITVDQEATWVGLGWNLQAGGSISRTVMDIPDDEEYYYEYERQSSGIGASYTAKVNEYGWLNNPDLIENFPELDFPNDTYKNSLDVDWSTSDDEVNAGIALNYLKFSNRMHEQTNHDCEPDIFYINVGNINAKFIFGFDGTPKLVDTDQKLDVQPIKNHPNSTSRITEFVITDSKGIKYFFGGDILEKTTIKTNYGVDLFNSLEYPTDISAAYWALGSYASYDISKTHTSAWFLTKIESPRGEVISFDYTNKNGITKNIPVTKVQTRNDLGTNIPWNNTISIEQNINTYYLNDIVFPNGVLDFTLSSRTDLLNSSKLDNITLKNLDLDQVYKYKFGYHYMNPNSGSDKQRLILDKVTKKGIVTNLAEEYVLDYHSGELPAKNSFKQDFWGCYSEKSTSLIPKIYVCPNLPIGHQYRCYPASGENEYIISGSDRTVDEDNILTGVLKSITYPTGGQTYYDLKPNIFYDEFSSSNLKGGGLRIEQIQNKDENDNILLNQKYSYNDGSNSSGILIYDLAYACPTNYSPANNITHFLYSWDDNDLSEDQKREYFTVRFTHNNYPGSDLNGHQIGYTKVEATEVGNGKVIKVYHPPKSYITNSSIVRSSSINAWGYGIQDISDPLLVKGFTGDTYRRTCESYNVDDDTKYRLRYKSSDIDDIDNVDICYYSDNSEITTSLNLNCYGGCNGLFYPAGITGFPLQVNNYYIFDWNAFKVKECDGKLFENSILYHDYHLDYKPIDWGDVSNSPEYNVFPFPPLSDLENEINLYSKLKSERYYKEGSNQENKIFEYNYELYNDNSERVFGIQHQQQYVVSGSVKASAFDIVPTPNSNLSAAFFFNNVHGAYILPRAWAKYYYNTNSTSLLRSVTETEKLEGGSIVKTTNYNYSDDYYLPISIMETQSDGCEIVNRIRYPFDFSSSDYTQMTQEHMLDYPVENITTKDGKVIAGTILDYKKNTDQNFYPDIFYNFSSTTPENLSACLFNGTTPNDQVWEDVATYDKYDNDRLVQYHLKDDINVSFYWGYNNHYPVILANNVSYEDLKTAITGIESDFETFITGLDDFTSSISITSWKTFNTQLREVLPEALITTYSYIPIVGISSVTDPNGKTTFYYYDKMNRLSTTKDHNGDIIQHVEYNHYDPAK